MKISDNSNEFKYIDPIPFRDINLEIKYEINEPIEFLYAYLFKKLHEIDGSTISAPTNIMNLPIESRENDPNLQLVPWYEINFRGNIIRLAKKSFTINASRSLPNWESYQPIISQILSIIGEYNNSLLFNNIKRIGLRDTTLFIDTCMFDLFQIKLSINEYPIEFNVDNAVTHITHSFKLDNYIIKIQAIDKANVESGTEKYTGSIIDSDIISEHFSYSTQNELLNHINEMHKLVNRVFHTFVPIK